MANLKLSLGMIPSTSRIEQAEADLIKEFEKLQAFVGSDELAHYNELEAFINSADFKNQKREIESLNFKQSEEYNRENELRTLQKSGDLKLYFKTRDGQSLKRFRELDGSDTIARYEELKGIVESGDFRQRQKAKEYKGSDDQKMFNEFKSLKGRSDIKAYYKFRASKELANFNQVDGSQKLARLAELKEYIATDEFKKRKEYLLDKKRFEKSDLFVKEQEYLKLKKSEDITWYFKVKDSDKFNVLKDKVLTFSDEFDGDSLDTKKWITNHYWGDKLLNDRYSLESDLHCYTESKNFEVRSGHLKIITKPEKIEGKVWNPALGGFRKKEFGYSSGIINTGKSFRQKYGIFSAKIKLTTGSGPRHAFWMLADKITPHIDICRTEKGKVWVDLFNNDKKGAKASVGSRYSKDFFIFSLEWTPEKMVWKVNGIEIMTRTSGLPDEEMYIILSGGLDKAISGSSAMEVDWVRVYQWNKK